MSTTYNLPMPCLIYFFQINNDGIDHGTISVVEPRTRVIREWAAVQVAHDLFIGLSHLLPTANTFFYIFSKKAPLHKQSKSLKSTGNILLDLSILHWCDDVLPYF